MKNKTYISFFSIALLLLVILLLYLWLHARTELKNSKSELIKVETTLLSNNKILQDSMDTKDVKIIASKRKIDSLMRIKPKIQYIALGGHQVDTMLCFDSTEVENMKREKAELAVLRELAPRQAEIIDEQSALIYYNEDKINELQAQRDNYEELYKKMKTLSEKDIQRERNLKRVFMGATPVALILGVIITAL